MMSAIPHLISHHLCPYVQRAFIVAAEKKVVLDRTYINLAAKPDWFVALSPTGKVPLLRVTDSAGDEHVLFESVAICEYLDETNGHPLLPTDALARAKTRAWVEFASGTLADIAGFYAANDETVFNVKTEALRRRFVQVEAMLVGPWFMGDRFGFVDAAFGPVFRYLDAFEGFAGMTLATGLPEVTKWRTALAMRTSVAEAVADDYSERLVDFLQARKSHLSLVMASYA